jgi:hypothetical protein
MREQSERYVIINRYTNEYLTSNLINWDRYYVDNTGKLVFDDPYIANINEQNRIISNVRHELKKNSKPTAEIEKIEACVVQNIYRSLI